MSGKKESFLKDLKEVLEKHSITIFQETVVSEIDKIDKTTNTILFSEENDGWVKESMSVSDFNSFISENVKWTSSFIDLDE